MSDDCAFGQAEQDSTPVKAAAVNKNDYVKDLGEYPVQQKNIDKFLASYPESRKEYRGHWFMAEIDGKPRRINVPQKVARNIHCMAEAKGCAYIFAIIRIIH